MRHENDKRLWDQLETALEMDPGEAQVEQVRDVVREAEAAGFLDLLVEARLAFIDVRVKWSNDAADVSDLLTGYIRCVSLYRTMPDRFNDRHVDNLWRGLGMVGIVMLEVADRPAEQIRGVLDDMEQRCRPDRDDLHILYLVRMRLEARVGNIAAADQAMRRLRTLTPADYTNPGGAVLEVIEYLAGIGRDAEAIAAMEPLLSGQVQHDSSTDPRDFLDWLLMPYLRTGQLEMARDAHRRTWRKKMNGFRLAAHLEFCARTGNEERGREVLHRNLDAFVGEIVMISELNASAAAALLCRRLIELGHGDEVWTWPADEEGGEEPEYTYRTLYGELIDDINAFVDKLDKSNGNTYQRERIDAVLNAPPIVNELRLSPVDEAIARITTPAAAPRPTPSPRPAPPAQPPSPIELLDTAERAQKVNDWALLVAALQQYDALTGFVPDEFSAARSAEFHAIITRDSTEGERLARFAADTYQRLGHPVRAQVCLGRLGQYLCLNEKLAQGAPLVAAAAAALRTTGDPYLIAGSQIWQGTAFEMAGNLDQALAVFAEAEQTLAGATADPQRSAILVGTSRFYRAQILARGLQEPRYAEAAALAGSAADAYRSGKSIRALIDARMLQAQAAKAVRDVDSALQAYREVAQVGAGTERGAVAHAARGELLLHAVGDPNQAITELVEAVAALTALGDPRAVYAQVDLATAYRTLDQWLDTAETAEAALATLDTRPEDLEQAMQARWMLVQAYEGLGQTDEALRVVEEMKARQDEGNPGEVAILAKKSASLLSATDADEEAAQEYLTAADAYAQANAISDEVDCRREAAKCLHWSALNDQAVALVEDVVKLTERLPAETEEGRHERAYTAYTAAQIFIGADREHEAIAYAFAAARGYQTVNEPAMAGVAELLAARLLHLEDQDAEAVVAARRALEKLPAGTDEHTEATEFLAELTRT